MSKASVKEEINSKIKYNDKGDITGEVLNDVLIDMVDEIPDPQVQSDWNQADSEEPDYIKNKPTIPERVVIELPADVTLQNLPAPYYDAGFASTLLALGPEKVIGAFLVENGKTLSDSPQIAFIYGCISASNNPTYFAICGHRGGSNLLQIFTED